MASTEAPIAIDANDLDASSARLYPPVLGALTANNQGATVEMKKPQLASWHQSAEDLREENGERLAYERLWSVLLSVK